MTIQLSNSGLRNLAVMFDESALRVGRLQPGDGSSGHLLDVDRAGVHYFPERGKKLQPMPPRIFRVGQRRRVACLARISGPGLYFVQCEALSWAVEFDMEGFCGDDVETPAEDAGRPVGILAVEQRLVHVDGGGSSVRQARNAGDPTISRL